MSIIRFHWTRFIGAIAALCLAVAYLMGLEKFSLAGFFVIGVYAAIVGIRIQRNTLPAKCDLCGNKGTMGVEYDAGFTNARLILHCPNCGRVVNTASQGIKPGKEKGQQE